MPDTKNNDVKEAIIRESTRLFLANGFRGTSVKKITEAAGIGRGTLYWYFKSKDEILITIFRKFETKLLDKLSETIRQGKGDFPAKYRLFHKYSTEFARDNRDLLLVFNTLLGEIVGNCSSAELKIKTIQRRYNRFVEKLLDEGKKEGIIGSSINPHIYSHIVTADLTGMLLQWYLNVDDIKDTTEYARSFRDSIMKGLEIKNPALARKQGDKGSGPGTSGVMEAKKLRAGKKR